MNAYADTLSSMGKAAVKCAERGWHVFPAPPGAKQSYESAANNQGRRWGATADADKAREFFARYP